VDDDEVQLVAADVLLGFIEPGLELSPGSAEAVCASVADETMLWLCSVKWSEASITPAP